jgi:Tfp pilus assembly protein PilF
VTLREAFQLGAQHHQAGRLAEAEAAYRQILSIAPNHPEALYRLAFIAQQRGWMNEAIALYRQALSAVETQPPAAGTTAAQTLYKVRVLSGMADALAVSGQFDQAIACYETAMKLAPDKFEALSNYAIALVHVNRLNQAAEVCGVALRRKPDSPELNYNMGGILCQVGRMDEGCAALRRALALNPSLELRVKLGLTLQRVAGLYDDAIECFRGMVGTGSRELDQEGYWRLTETGRMKAALAEKGQDIPKLPYVGDKVVVLHCDRAVRERLRRMGLHGGYSVDQRDGAEIWLSTHLAAACDPLKLPELIGRWLEWMRNEAAMAGDICTVWMPQMPQAVAEAVRRAAGEDLIEIAADSAEEIAAQLAARAVTPPDTEGKFFAVASIRNGGAELLPHWLEHYTQLGVDEILLGVFDDLGGAAAAELERCAARWKFRRFTQHWEGATESETYCQRQAGCRRAGARPGTWILHTDLDELQQYPAPLSEIGAAAERMNIRLIQGCLIDRVAANGSLPAIAPRPSLWEQFPVECSITERVVKGVPSKAMLARYSVLVGTGHHDSLLEPAKPPPIGSPADYRVAHFKWHRDVVQRMRWGLQQESASSFWKADTRRLLAWLESNGGKINLSDPALFRL